MLYHVNDSPSCALLVSVSSRIELCLQSLTMCRCFVRYLQRSPPVFERIALTDDLGTAFVNVL